MAVIIGGLGGGIGFGLQDITKNLLSGLTVLLERKLKVGDFIEFDDIAGYIEEISIRSTVIRTLEGGEVIIPNSQLAEERITNWNYRDCRGRLEVDVGVAYGSDPVLVTETLLEAAYSLSSVLCEPPPKVIFAELGDSSLNFKLYFWIARVDLRARIKSEVTFSVEYYLRQRNINIPFPQMDIWMRSPNSSPQVATVKAQLPSPESTPQEFLESVPNEAVSSKYEPLKDKLSQISYFQGFNELQIRSLVEMGYRQYLEQGEVVAQQGKEFRKFCIILSGYVEVLRITGNQEKHIRNFGPGEYFGELPLMLNLPSPGVIRSANTEVTLFVINQANFEQLLSNYPALAEDVANELSSRKDNIREMYPEIWAEMHSATRHDSSPAVWIKQRLKSLFASSPS
ncbi:MAG: mechanosensitive ion channel domain-containing protein [Cyanophyceae cyanobacterium]